MYGSKRAYAGRQGGKPAKKAKTVAAQVSRLQRQVALLRPETKYKLGGVSSVNVTAAAGVIFPLCTIAGGAGADERVGLEIRGVYLKWMNTYTRASLSAGSKYRLFVIKDKENAGNAPTISGAASAILETFVPQTTFLQNQSRDRFQILYDKLVTVEATSTYPGNADIQKGFLKIPFPIRFNSAGAGATDMAKNTLWFVILVDGGDTGDFSTYWEIAFSDV